MMVLIFIFFLGLGVMVTWGCQRGLKTGFVAALALTGYWFSFHASNTLNLNW